MKYWTLYLLLLFCCNLTAQNIKEKYKLADEYWHKYNAKYYKGDIKPHWINNTHSLWYKTKTAEGIHFILIDADKKTKQPAFDHQKLAQALSAATQQKVDPRQLPFGEISFTEDLNEITFQWKDIAYTNSRKKNKISNQKPTEQRRNSGYWGSVDQENRT